MNDVRVLLVEDQELFRTGVARILNAQDGLVVAGEAADGAQGVELADQVAPDVVLMDIRMPVMDGVEATRQLFSPARTMTRTTPLRVIVLTTFNLDDRAATAIRLGASGFLLKDATPTMLREAILTVHAGNALLAPRDLTSLLRHEPMRQTAALPPEYATLTEREREVVAAIARGLSNAEIGAAMFAAESTVKTHVGHVLRKLGLRDRVQIVVFAYQHRLA